MRRPNNTPDPTDEDRALQEAMQQRKAQRMAEMRDPEEVGTGTEVISARLAAARARRDRTPSGLIDLR